MSELGLILLGALLVNNFVLAQFLGLCPFMGITRSYETAYATGLATTFVLTFASVCAHIIYHNILLPLDLEYLKIIVFIVISFFFVNIAIPNHHLRETFFGSESYIILIRYPYDSEL